MTEPTLVQLVQSSFSQFGDRTAMTYKRNGSWHTLTYSAVSRFVEDLAGGLIDLGVKKGDRVAIWSGNSPEWVITDFAILHTAAVSVPIYQTLTPEQAAYIFRDSEARVIFVEDKAKLEAVLARLDQLPQVRAIVMMGPVPEGYEAKGNIVGMHDLYTKGRAFLARDPGELRRRADSLKASELATLVYTSGTTGNPKGVMLTHDNIGSNAAALRQVFALPPGAVFLAFLPLCHSFARMSDEYFAYSSGATVAFAESIEKLAQNMQEVRPHVMGSVPRLYEKMYAKVLDGVAKSSRTKQGIFAWAVGVGKEVATLTTHGKSVPLGLKLKHKVATALVFKKLQHATGGRLKVFVSGGAALSPEIQEFFSAAGMWIWQGYGLTETSPVISLNTMPLPGFVEGAPCATRFGSAGKAIPGVEVRIDTEGWQGNPGEGEILTRGRHVCLGYYKLDKETRELLTDDGWLRTGDVGKFDDDGFIWITDRKKELFKTAYGKYIAPQFLEGKLKNQPHVAMAVILGENKQYVSALIAPNFEKLEPWAKEQGIAFSTRHELVRNPKVRELLQREVDEVNKDLSRYEQIKAFELLPRELTQDEGELTPTLKVKRRVINENYASEIGHLYEKE